MRYVIFADVHSNLEALEEMLGYLEGEQIDQYLMLGDVVGYGANPSECLSLVTEVCNVILCGNHERALFSEEVAASFNPLAKMAVEWTKKILTIDEKNKIEPLPYMHITDIFTLAHGSPDHPEEFRYLFYYDDCWLSFASLKTRLCFVGHTHVPQIFLEKKAQARYLTPGKYKLDKNEKYIINVGSVGQPRDQDKRLSFALFDDQEYMLELIRLTYNNRRAAEKILKANLPTYLAARLL